MRISHREEFSEGNAEEERVYVCEGRGRVSEKGRGCCFLFIVHLLHRILFYISSLAHAVPVAICTEARCFASVWCLCLRARVCSYEDASDGVHTLIDMSTQTRKRSEQNFLFCAFLSFDALTKRKS